MVKELSEQPWEGTLLERGFFIAVGRGCTFSFADMLAMEAFVETKPWAVLMVHTSLSTYCTPGTGLRVPHVSTHLQQPSKLGAYYRQANV